MGHVDGPRETKPPRDDCATCGHIWHGLPCGKHIHAGGWFPDAGRVCGCPGPWAAA